MVFKFIIKLL